MRDSAQIRERVIDDDGSGSIRAAIYARTSSHAQEYGYSLEEQVQQAIDRCRSLDWNIRFIFRDAAESGDDTDRPMFQKMLDNAERDRFDVVVFWKLDRFSRSLLHAVQLESELREHQVALYSITEQIDTTSATGRFNFRNIASAAQFERDMIKERTQMGLNALAAEHRWPNDSPPLGYSLTSDGKLDVIEDERDLVIEIFNLYIDEHSMPAVAGILNERGARTKEDGEWTPRAIGDVLRNQIYIGQYEVSDVTEHVPEYQIIEDDTFEKVTSIRHRFQDNDTSRGSMPTSRKEKLIQNIRQTYDEYLQSCH